MDLISVLHSVCYFFDEHSISTLNTSLTSRRREKYTFFFSTPKAVVNFHNDTFFSVNLRIILRTSSRTLIVKSN